MNNDPSSCNLVFAGVGGQGVLSVAGIIAQSAMHEGYFLKQSEIHGMSQRGGAVMATIRISKTPIHSPLVTKGQADLILSVEPMESLRYLDYLKPSGHVVTSSVPFKNISNYPDLDHLLESVRNIKGSVLVDSEKLAREAGSARFANVVMVGAACIYLPIKQSTITTCIRKIFESKGEAVIHQNLKAFELGLEAAKK